MTGVFLTDGIGRADTPGQEKQKNPPDNKRNTDPEQTAPQAPALSLRAHTGDTAMPGSPPKPQRR